MPRRQPLRCTRVRGAGVPGSKALGCCGADVCTCLASAGAVQNRGMTTRDRALPKGPGGRPHGEVNRALRQAVGELATPDRGVTLREAAAHACVGVRAARHTLGSLVRSGALVIARTRRVPYRNRPVAEYALPAPASAPAGTGDGGMGALLSAWGGACPAGPAVGD